MLCPNCKMRWAPFPEGWPDVRLTKEEEEIRLKDFNNNESIYCGCIEQDIEYDYIEREFPL